jgi:hypothetical protein
MNAKQKGGEASGSGASPERVEYLKWSCEHLAAAFEHETTRTDRIRDQATAAFLALPVFVGLAAGSEAWKADNLGVSVCRVLALICAAVALGAWYMVVRVDVHPRISVALFTADDGKEREEDFEFRVLRVRDYLVEAVADGQARGSALASRRRWALLATCVTILFAGLPLLLKTLR